MTPTIGRSHGIHAEPTTFGAQARLCLCRVRARPRAAASPRARRSRPAPSPARSAPSPRSTRASRSMSPRRWGSRVEPVSTQVIPRDRHAMYFATLGVVASSIERLATEIRHLQRTEVLEAEEFFSEGQKGSSAMPHKRNPVLSENLTGLARMVRAYAHAGDGERRALARARHLAFLGRAHDRPGRDRDARLRARRLAGVIDKLVVYPENMQKNLDRLGGLVHSQRVLLALTQKGVAREDAYRAGAAQRHEGVAAARATSSPLLKADPDVRAKLSRRGARGQFRPRLSLQARRHDLQAGVRGRLTSPSSAMATPATILVFDSGLGGLTVFREVAAARPDARYVYVADDAGFPYGNMPEEALITRIVHVIGKAIDRARARSGRGRLQHRLDAGARRNCARASRCPSSAPCRRSSRPARSRRPSASPCSARRRPSAANIPAR